MGNKIAAKIRLLQGFRHSSQRLRHALCIWFLRPILIHLRNLDAGHHANRYTLNGSGDPIELPGDKEDEWIPSI